MYYDITIIISILITTLAQVYISFNYKKYQNIENDNSITGAEAARLILKNNNLSSIYVVETSGYLSDHYDPGRKVIKLSRTVYNSSSISAVAVACHECGHAIQDKEDYSFMRFRSFLVPFTNFSSYAGYIAIFLGCLLGMLKLIWIGILLEMVILLFEIVTLPVEFNASKRALKEIEKNNILTSEELQFGKKVLKAAAFTYVASVGTTILQILRLKLMFGNRED